MASITNNLGPRSHKRRELLTHVVATTPFPIMKQYGFTITKSYYKTLQSQPNQLHHKHNGSQWFHREQLQHFLMNHSVPAANEIRVHNGDRVAARVLTMSKRELHQQFQLEWGEISFTCFRKAIPPFYIKPRRKTDMCDHCAKGEREAKLLQQEQDQARRAILQQSVDFYHHHLARVKQQRQLYHSDLTNLQPGEMLLVIDFKENLKLRAPLEESRDFYSSQFRSVFGVMMVFNHNGNIRKKYIDFISESLSKDTVAAIDCLDLLLESADFKSISPRLIKFWCDCGGTFRSKAFLHYTLVHLPEKKIATEVNFFAEKHGKSDIDGHFSRISVALEEGTRYSAVSNTEELISMFKKHFTGTQTNADFIEYRFIPNRREYKSMHVPNVQDFYYFKVIFH